MDYTTPSYPQTPGSGVPGMPGMPGGPAGMPGQPVPTPEKPGKRSRKAKEPKAPTKKLVSRQFTIALAFAGLAAAAIYGVTQGSTAPGHFVVVASGPIATDTTVDAKLLKAVSISEEMTQPGAVVGDTAQEAVDKAVAQLDGVRSQFPITANQQIVPDQFGPVVNLDKPLEGDERLVSFRASVAASVAGSISAGDHVDIFATAGDVAGPIMYDVTVVSVTVSEDRYNAVADAQSGDKNVRASDVLPGDPVPGTYVVRVKAGEVGKVIAADATGKIYLVYRNADANQSPVSPTTAKDAICAADTTALPACQ